MVVHRLSVKTGNDKGEADRAMSALESKLAAMGHTLPAPFQFPKPNRTGCVVAGSVIFVSGHGRNLTGPGVKAKARSDRT
jgi:hypothetical protein